MKKSGFYIGLMIFAFLAMTACQLDTNPIPASEFGIRTTVPEDMVVPYPIPQNPTPEELGVLPEATVPLNPVLAVPMMRATAFMSDESTPVATLEPSTLTATLMPGQSILEHKTAALPANLQPPMGDILVSFDLTGSMYEELANVKVNALNIANAVRGFIPDTNFGVVSHMDYPDSYPYNPVNQDVLTMYGSEAYPPNYPEDYPYLLNLSPAADINDFSTAISKLPKGQGADFPESYTRVFYESYADTGIGWRDGAKKIVLAWLDAVPHDYDFAEILDSTLNVTTGPDPGRDSKAGTSDDLEILSVLDEMKVNNITLIAIYSGYPKGFYDPALGWIGGFALWQAYAQRTGGDAFQIKLDGTIPDGTPIDDFIAGLITETVAHIDKLELKVLDPVFAPWLTILDPASYSDIDLDVDKTFGFDIRLTVPSGTPDGVNNFKVSLIGDGVTYAEQDVVITVVNEIAVPVDIKPGSWPNPINTKSNGVLPVAIAGTGSFDVHDIDPSTVYLEGIPLIRWNYEDVTTPFVPYTDKPLDGTGGAALSPDGIMDMTLKFDTPAVVAALGVLNDGETRRLRLTGSLIDGTPIVGEDIVKIIDKK